MAPGSATPAPPFAWSESRARRWQVCRREHYYAVYLAQGGWRPDAPAERRRAWALGKLVVSWFAALGTAVHDRVTECIRACAAGDPLPTFAALRRAAARDLNAVYLASSKHRVDFWRDPARWPVLASRMYGEPWRSEDFVRTAARLDEALDTLLCADDLWAVVRRAGVSGVRVPKRWSAFTLPPDLTVYAAPDAVVVPDPAAAVEVWEFKTGGGDGAVDQTMTYALSERYGPPAASPAIAGSVRHAPRFVGRVIALGGGPSPDARAPFAITEADLDGAAARIRASAAAMRAELVDAERNVPGPIDAYPRTTQRWRCAHCRYRGLCEPDRYPLPLSGSASARPDAVTE